ncbi:hypothetical protein Tco_0368795 [Tanacetum coccineum]
MLRSEVQGEDFAKKMVNLVNQRKKYFAEERARAKRNKPMTQSQLKTYMMNYLKNQGIWKLSQLKSLSFEEFKKEFDKLVKQVESFAPINFEATKASLKRFGEELQTKTPKRLKDDEDVEAKDDEPTKKSGKRRKQMARKGLHTSVDKDDSKDSDEVGEQEESVTGTKTPIDLVPIAMKTPSIATYKIFKQGEKGAYQIVRELFFELRFMESDDSDQDARYALSKLLQSGTVAEYENELLMLMKRVTRISESLLKSFYISGLKLLLQCALLMLAPTTLEEAFSIARIMEARFETIAGKKLNIEEKIDIVLSWPSEEAPPEIKGSLDADEDIGVDAVSSAIDCVIHIGESNEVRSKFGEFSDNKERVVEVVVGGGEALGVYREKSRGAAEGGRRVLCYVQGSRRRKKKKMEAAIQRRLWDPGIKSVFQDNTLRARWF